MPSPLMPDFTCPDPVWVAYVNLLLDSASTMRRWPRSSVAPSSGGRGGPPRLGRHMPSQVAGVVERVIGEGESTLSPARERGTGAE